MSFAVKNEPKKQSLFDNIGNRNIVTNNSETTQYQANSLNQYTNITDGVTNSPTYDTDGNMLSNGEWTYAWNGENRLVTASNATTVLSFKYDYMGRRFSKTVDGAETTFIYDGWNLISESSSTATNHYTWGLDLSQSLQGAGGVGGLLSVTEADSDTYTYCYDANGNVMQLVDSAGSVQASYEYDAFGNIIASSGTMADENPFRFSTKHYDDETKLSYYGFRYYDAGMGRWLNRDPIGENGGENLYAMVRNNAVDYNDYLGLEKKKLFGCCKDEDIVAELQRMLKIAGRLTKKPFLVINRGRPGHPAFDRYYKEYGGYICCNKKTGKGSSVGPYAGTWRFENEHGVEYFSDKKEDLIKVGTKGAKIKGGNPTSSNFAGDPEKMCKAPLVNVAFYHSHPPGSLRLSGQKRSDGTYSGDIGWSIRNNMPIAMYPSQGDEMIVGIPGHGTETFNMNEEWTNATAEPSGTTAR
ncbi:hypothetical protein BVX97_02690 [bacterium E08(2017)]|nr:hypothetical protein BVX97_02690 [bacterium E08(2017)]